MKKCVDKFHVAQETDHFQMTTCSGRGRMQDGADIGTAVAYTLSYSSPVTKYNLALLTGNSRRLFIQIAGTSRDHLFLRNAQKNKKFQSVERHMTDNLANHVVHGRQNIWLNCLLHGALSCPEEWLTLVMMYRKT